MTGGDVLAEIPEFKDKTSQTIDIVVDFGGDEHHFSFIAKYK
jgi:hypothetical protein